MKEFFKIMYRKLQRNATAALASVLGLGLSTQTAHAALDGQLLTTTTAIETLVSDMVSWAWPVVAAILTFAIGAKLLKKVAHKAT